MITRLIKEIYLALPMHQFAAPMTLMVRLQTNIIIGDTNVIVTDDSHIKSVVSLHRRISPPVVLNSSSLGKRCQRQSDIDRNGDSTRSLTRYFTPSYVLLGKYDQGTIWPIEMLLCYM